MSNLACACVVGLLGLHALGMAAAQQPDLPPVHSLGRVLATLRDTIGNGFSVRPLSDGRALVENPTARTVALYDSTLTRADTIIGGSNPAVRGYPGLGSAAMIAWPGDTTLLVDARAIAFVVIDPAGHPLWTTALPPADFLFSIGASAAPDLHGRIVFTYASTRMVPTPDPTGKGPPIWMIPDSLPVVRFDLRSLRVDSVAYVHSQFYFPVKRTVDPDGTIWDTQVSNPLPRADAFAALSDGTIAIVRAQDYHIDWISSDGARATSERVAHKWYRYSDSEHVAIIDSVSKATIANAAAHPRLQTSETDTARKRTLIPAFPDPDELPTYEAPFVKPLYADADDHLWIQEKRIDPASASTGGRVYEIVDRQAHIIDRVRVPNGANIVGFTHGAVYLSSDLGHSASLVRIAIR